MRRRARLLRQRLAFHQHLYLICIQNLAFQQRQRDMFQRVAIRLHDVLRFLVSLAYDALYFLVDLQRRIFTEVAMLGNFAAQEDRFFLLAVTPAGPCGSYPIRKPCCAQCR